MRRMIWPALTLVVGGAAFGLGHLGNAPRAVPALVATLPGDEAGFSHEFDNRIRDRFPPGSSEDALVDYLVGEKFVPDWRRRDGPNASVLRLTGLVCEKVIRVNWQADAAGVLTAVSGSYASHCL